MYIQSCVTDAWREAIDWLVDNPEKQLLFFGLGCQAAGFASLCRMKGVLDRITIIDIICHGVPSPKLWKEYVASLEKRGKLSNINFRDKRTGWEKSIGVAKLNGKEISLQKWRKVYSSRRIMRPCCSLCPYTTIERKTEITIGDFWGMEKSLSQFYDPMGTSVFIIHSEKGQALFDRIKKQLDYRESNPVDCKQPNLERPTKHAEGRELFWKEYRRKGIDYVINKYGSDSLFSRIRRKVSYQLRK